jgi:hypothetical protein
MNLIADILLAAGAFGAAIYCSILSARLKKFSALESGMGGAIAVLSGQVDDMTIALETARGAATGSATRLDSLTQRAEAAATKLELLVASLHDLHDDAPSQSASDVSEATHDGTRRVRVVRRRLERNELEAAE